MICEEARLYSVAVFDDLLNTRSDNKNIRLWKHHTEFSGFKFDNCLAKAIIISDERILFGH